MIYRVEENLTDFKFWSGGKDRADLLTYDELDELDGCLCELLGDEPTDTEINDLFWFNFGDVCNLIGLDEDEVLKRNDD